MACFESFIDPEFRLLTLTLLNCGSNSFSEIVTFNGTESGFLHFLWQTWSTSMTALMKNTFPDVEAVFTFCVI